MQTPEQLKRLKDLLTRHEGLRLKPYRDTVGKLTIGVGRNLDDIGISLDEANTMLINDIDRVLIEASRFPWFSNLSVARQDVIVSMIFNLGLGGFNKFKKLISALQVQNYERAADEMSDSKWSKQVGIRAKELSDMMRLDRYPSN